METFAQLLRDWRRQRGKSQLALAGEAGVSTRHLSFIENGRARPSREMVGALADVLDVPLRERNRLLVAAGLAPEYSAHRLSDDEMREARTAIELILRGHAPFPAVCIDRAAGLVMANEAYLILARALSALPRDVAAYTLVPEPRPNIFRFLLESPLSRQLIRNYDEVVAVMVARARRELVRRADRALRAELEILVRASARLPSHDAGAPARLLLPVELALAGEIVRFTTTVATLGTTFDITLDELRIEFYHPADARSDALARAWLGAFTS